MYRKLVCIVASLLYSSASGAVMYNIRDLGTLGGQSYATSVNFNGQVTGYSYTKIGDGFESEPHAFLYRDGVMADLGTLGGTVSFGYGINSYAQTTGSSSLLGDTARHAFLYSAGTMTDLGTLGGTNSRGYGINDAGYVVGSSDTNGGDQHAFIAHAGLMTDIGTLGGASEARSINASGQVVGYSFVDGAAHAFLYSAGVMTDLGTLGGANSRAYDIDDAGQIVGESQQEENPFRRAFTYSAGTMTNLGTVDGKPTSESLGLGINNLGQVVGIAHNAGPESFGFFYSSGLMTNLNDLLLPSSGWTVKEAWNINDQSQIVGYGIRDGQARAFLMTPVPEPATWAMMIGGFALAGAGLRRSRAVVSFR